jgi:hypothetical protein
MTENESNEQLNEMVEKEAILFLSGLTTRHCPLWSVNITQNWQPNYTMSPSELKLGTFQMGERRCNESFNWFF